MKKEENMYFETRSARNTASLLKPLTLVMGFPSALCLLPSALPPLAALPKALKRYLSAYEVTTVQEQGWAGVKNGELIARIDEVYDAISLIN